MKFLIIPFLLITHLCTGQNWEGEIMLGVSAYKGDLTEKFMPPKIVRPAVNLNIKYNIDNFFILRAGIAFINVAADDKYNKREDLKGRNLNFKSSIWEASICTEINILEPELFTAYPYVFCGVGIFHFNPYTYDKDNKKTFLQPLGTEGQGIAGYNRKPYSLTQLCLPLGAGMKVNINKKYDFVFEIGYRFLFTDYLDDVSTTYLTTQTLLEKRGPKTAELAYRAAPLPNVPYNGKVRGNPKIKDAYFLSGVKLLMHLGKEPTE